MAYVTETVSPFTAAYLNMTPNNANNIGQLVCDLEMNGKKNTDIHYLSPLIKPS